MNKYWSRTVRNIEPYVPGEQPKDRRYIKLNTNENPYPPSPRALEAIRLAADETLRLYPDPNGDELREAIAGHYNISKEQVFVGNGSDEVLAFSFPAFFDPAGKDLIFADITYSFYPVYADFFHVNYRLIPLDDEFNLREEGYDSDNGGIIIANPNAPTGRDVSLKTIETILSRNQNSVVMIDEAYADFGSQSSVTLIRDYQNLLIIRTFSKSHSLAGLRVGYAMGDEGLIEGLNRVKNSLNSYTLDRLALAGARVAINDDAYFQETKSKIIKTRERVTARLTETGFKVIPSRTNFIFIKSPDCSGGEMLQRLKERGILVRHFNRPRINNFIRVTIGTDAEMDAFMEAISDCA